MPETASPDPQGSPVRRYTATDPCQVCGGWPALPPHQGVRCPGFSSSDGRWAHCTREEWAGALPLDQRTQPPTYLHRLDGDCRCGRDHIARTDRAPSGTPAAYSDRLEASYLYCDALGRVVYGVDRFRGKRFAQWRPNGRGGRVFNLNGVQPLPYRLPELLATAPEDTVDVAEGEKDVDRLRSLGRVATTNSGGAGGWTDAHSEHLRGRKRVVILEDNDAAGRDRTTAVARSVQEVGRVADVRVLQLPGLPEHGDVSDWLDAGHTSAELQELADRAPSWTPQRGESTAFSVSPAQGRAASLRPDLEMADELDAWAVAAIPAYPLQVLPGPLRELVDANPGLPPALIAGAGLAAAAAAIGPNAAVELRPGWTRRAIVWIATIAPRGAGKSPAEGAAFRPLRSYDAKVLCEYQDALLEWRKTPVKARGPRPRDPTILGGDATLEALARRLDRSGGAAALDLDELGQFLRGVGEYKRGGGGDRGRVLALWTGDPWRVQRVTDDLDIYIPRPTVVICGGLQPALHELLGSESDGMRPRWLPHLAGMPTEQEGGSAPPASWETLLLELVGMRDRGRVIALTTAARERFSGYQRRWKQAAQGVEGETVSAALQKADLQALAVLLILAEMERPGVGGAVGPELVDRAARAIDFCIDCWRALPELGGFALSRRDEILDRGVERLRDFLEQHGGKASRRALSRHAVAGARTKADLDELLRRYEAVYPGTVTVEDTGRPGPRPVVVRAPTRDVSPRDVLSLDGSRATVSADDCEYPLSGEGSADSECGSVSATGKSGAPQSADNALPDGESADNYPHDSARSPSLGGGISRTYEAEREDDPPAGAASARGAADCGTPAGVLAALRIGGCTLTVSTDSRGQRELVITGDDIAPILLGAAKRHRLGLIELLADPELVP